MRILSVAHGSKRIGIAISDETGTIARPLAVLAHVTREEDATAVARLAVTNEVALIVVGQSIDDGGVPTMAGRRSARFGDALRQQTSLPVVLWDEVFTTQDARSARIAGGASRRKRSGHLDDLAAALLLQDYLDSRSAEKRSK